jgi:hypothetical protein
VIISNNIISTGEIIGISRMHVQEQEDGRASIVNYKYKIYTRFSEIEITSDSFQFSSGFHDLDRKKIEEFNADFLAAQRRISIILGERFCRQCGCTETTACRDEQSGAPCHWVEEDLCSSCFKINTHFAGNKKTAAKSTPPVISNVKPPAIRKSKKNTVKIKS